MLVRLNIGRLAGKIQDIEPSAAKAMIADGRAALPQYEQGNTEPEGVAKLAAAAAPATEAETADSTKSAKSAKKK